MEINENQHPDFIWTWKSSHRSKRASLWIPYFQSVERLPKGKGDRYLIQFNGGAIQFHLKEIDFLMFYGASGELPLAFLDRLAQYKIPLIIHRRNMPKPYVFFPEAGPAEADVLTQQILARENDIRRCYIARTLIRERLNTLAPIIKISNTTMRRLATCRRLESIRAVEAYATKRYWNGYYQRLGLNDMTRRDKSHPINTALDAGSFFFFGILLRWLLFHKFSPYHGYLHEPTSYPSLCYDLMEPYRRYIEEAAADAYLEGEDEDQEGITRKCLVKLKQGLTETVYVPASRQAVARKNLLHGAVLALRAYLLQDMRRLVLPVEGVRKGGRPPKVNFRLPGGR